MSKTIPVLLAVVAAIPGFFYWQEKRKAAEREVESINVKQLLAEAEAEAEKQEQRNQAEQARLSAVNAQLAEKAAKALPHEQSAATDARTLAPATADGTRAKHPMADVFHDPAMKDVLRHQAKEAVQRSVKQLVTTDLIRQLSLTDEQIAVLKKLLSQRGTIGFEFMTPLMTGELDDAGLAELGRQTRGEMDAVTDELKSLLGDAGYHTFEVHEKAQPDRERVDGLAARLKESGQALSPEQRRELLALMFEERSQFTFTIDYGDTSGIDYEHFHDFYREDKMDRYFQEMEQLNDRINQRAQSILDAGQAAEFQEVLKTHLLKRKYVVKTTNAMLGRRAGR